MLSGPWAALLALQKSAGIYPHTDNYNKEKGVKTHTEQEKRSGKKGKLSCQSKPAEKHKRGEERF